MWVNDSLFTPIIIVPESSGQNSMDAKAVVEKKSLLDKIKGKLQKL
jgi:hypothetical protein